MKFSAWSSLVISASSALALAAPAAAHVSIVPSAVGAGSDVDVTISVPNEGDARGIVRVTIGIPAEFQLDDAEAKPGWTQMRTGQAITWAGGRIPKGQYATFGLRGTAPRRAETVLFNVLVGSRSGKTTTYRIALNVRTHAARDVGARTLGKAALFVALAAALLALGAGFLALYVWLRPPPL
jgi:hypothetical protein